MDALSLDRWQQIDALFAEAIERPEEERTAFLRATCGHDVDLYEEVLSLLESDARATAVLGESAAAFAAPLLADGPPPSHAADLPAGARVGPYRILDLLGRGGMGSVYLAERADGAFEKRVALKLVKRGMDTDEVLGRFRRERQLLAGLDHAHIARLLDGGATVDGRPYLVMECVLGETITAYADRRRLSVDARLALLAQVAEAVTYAHRRLVVHRDLKPSNVLVTNEGEVKLLDFGIARLLAEEADESSPRTRPESRILTPAYAAPEQIRGEVVTTATDVYALGVLLYELLAGRRPDDSLRPPSRCVSVKVAPDGIPRSIRTDLDTLTLTALHPDPARRYASAEALLDDLQRLRTGLPLRARPDSRRYRISKFVARHRAGVAIAAAALLTLCAFTVILFAQQRETVRERDRAESALARAERTASFLEGLFLAATPFADERRDTLSARDLLERGLANAEHDLAADPILQAHMREVIGHAQTDLGLYDEAETTLRRGLELLADPSADPLDRASMEAALASALYLSNDVEDLEDAEALLRSALATRRDRLGSDHVLTAALLNDLALVRSRRGAPDEAEEIFWEALDLHRAATRPDTMELATTSKNLADLLADRSRFTEAEPLMRESIELRRSYLGNEHPSVAVGLHSLATLLRDLERYDEAEPLIREALAINTSALGADHPHLVDNLGLLGSVLRGMGRMDEAADALRENVALARRIHRDQHPDLAVALNTFAGLLIAGKDFDDAERLLNEAVEITRHAYGADHPVVGFNVARRGSARHGRGAHAAAVEDYRDALHIFESYFGAGTLHVALAQGNLAGCLVDLGHYAEAEPLLLASLDALNTLHDADHPRVTATRARLNSLYEAWGRPERAAWAHHPP